MENIPHYLLDYLEPLEPFYPKLYRNLAIEKIGDIIKRNKIPIVVGGTLYYVQSLLYQDSLIEEDVINSFTFVNNINNDKKSNKKINLTDVSNSDMYNILKEIDPIMSNKLHPHDYRRIRRSIEIFNNTGI